MEPLVLLHGLVSSPKIWDPVVPLLERSYDLFIPALGGHRGGAPLEDETFEGVLADLERQLDSAGIERAHLVGNSLGGILAAELARRGRALSLTNFAGPLSWSNRAAARKLVLKIRVAQRLFRIPLVIPLLARLPGPLRRLLLHNLMNHGERLTSDEVASVLINMRDTQAAVPIARSLIRRGDHPEISGSYPITLVWPESDGVTPWDGFGAGTLALLPGADLLRSTTGHTPTWDDPHGVVQIINETVDRSRRLNEEGRDHA